MSIASVSASRPSAQPTPRLSTGTHVVATLLEGDGSTPITADTSISSGRPLPSVPDMLAAADAAIRNGAGLVNSTWGAPTPAGTAELQTTHATPAASPKPQRNWGQDRMHDAIPWPIPAAPQPPVDPIIQPTPKYH